MSIDVRRSMEAMSEEEKGFVRALRKDSDSKTWLVYADWLEENGRSAEAWQARARGGTCRVVYYARCKKPGYQILWAWSRPRLRRNDLVKSLQRAPEVVATKRHAKWGDPDYRVLLRPDEIEIVMKAEMFTEVEAKLLSEEVEGA